MTKLPPVDVSELLPELRQSGIALLRVLSEEDWQKPTACAGWNAHDVALHIAGGLLANVSRRRDGHPGNFGFFAPAGTTGESADALGDTLNAWNEAWVVAARRISPPLLIEIIDLAGRELEAYFRTLDPMAIGDPVGWAGPDPAPVWLDIAREYTELWTHLAQVREATGRDLVDDPRLFAPVLDTFMRAVPHTLRNIDRQPGTTLMIEISGPAGGVWSVQRTDAGWRIGTGNQTTPDALVTLDQVVAWRLATKGMSPVDASRRVAVRGDKELGEGFLSLVAILG